MGNKEGINVSDRDVSTDSRPVGGPKKAYARPTLTEYGSVAKLTMTKGSTNVEISPNKRTGCL